MLSLVDLLLFLRIKKYKMYVLSTYEWFIIHINKNSLGSPIIFKSIKGPKKVENYHIRIKH